MIVICMMICIDDGIWLWIDEINKLENVVISVNVIDMISVFFKFEVIVSVE